MADDIFRRPFGLLFRDASSTIAVGTGTAITCLLSRSLLSLLHQFDPLLFEITYTGQTGSIEIGLTNLLPTYHPNATASLVDGIPLRHSQDASVLLGLLPIAGNLRREGTLKNKSSTLMVVPSRPADGVGLVAVGLPSL